MELQYTNDDFREALEQFQNHVENALKAQFRRDQSSHAMHTELAINYRDELCDLFDHLVAVANGEVSE